MDLNLVKDNFEIHKQEVNGEDKLMSIMRHIDPCARLCYKSQNTKGDEGTKTFVNGLIKTGHLSPLEHAAVYLKGGKELLKYMFNEFSIVSVVKGETVYVSTNYRVIVENEWEDDLKYMVDPDWNFHEKRITVLLTVDRGVGEEYLRHRPSSFSKESTRYVNYTKDRHGNMANIIIPEVDFPDMPEGIAIKMEMLDETKNTGETVWGIITHENYEFAQKDPSNPTIYEVIYFQGTPEYDYLDGQAESMNSYEKMVKVHGWDAQRARRQLSLNIKGEFAMTAWEREWQHVMNLRTHETTGKAHPDMRHINDRIYELLHNSPEYDIN